MAYYINEERVNADDFYHALEDSIYDYLFDEFDSLIDDTYPPVKILHGIEYNPSMVLFRVDRAAYDQLKDNYLDNLLDEAQHSLEQGEEVSFYNKTFRVTDEDDTEFEEQEKTKLRESEIADSWFSEEDE